MKTISKEVEKVDKKKKNTKKNSGINILRHNIDGPIYDGKEMSVEEYLEIDDDEYKYEYVNGRCVLKEMSTKTHSAICLWIDELISSYLRENNVGIVYLDGLRIYTIDNNYRVPDASVVIGDTIENIKNEKYHSRPAELMIEIISDTSKKRDLIEKCEEYERAGVKEYWVIDPKRKNTHFFVLEGKKFIDVDIKSGIFKSNLLKGLQIRLEDLYNLVSPKELEDDIFYINSFGAPKKRGFERGFENGFENGIEKGILVGKIIAIQEIKGIKKYSKEDLQKLSIEELKNILNNKIE